MLHIGFFREAVLTKEMQVCWDLKKWLQHVVAMFSLIRRGDHAVIHDTYVENEVLTMDLSVHFPNVEELVNPVRSWVCHSAAPTKQMSGQQWPIGPSIRPTERPRNGDVF